MDETREHLRDYAMLAAGLAPWVWFLVWMVTR